LGIVTATLQIFLSIPGAPRWCHRHDLSMLEAHGLLREPQLWDGGRLPISGHDSLRTDDVPGTAVMLTAVQSLRLHLVA
jgi:hypothetical protein